MAALDPALRELLHGGTVIPAHPLALTAAGKIDERHQRALTRYYCAAGVGGVAVGVHTTQFEIHEPSRGLLAPVLALAAQTVDAYLREQTRPFLKIAGLVGRTEQAVNEADLAVGLGYHAGLLSLSAFRNGHNFISHGRNVLQEHFPATEAADVPLHQRLAVGAVEGRLHLVEKNPAVERRAERIVPVKGLLVSRRPLWQASPVLPS